MSYGQTSNGPRRFVPAQAWMYDKNAMAEKRRQEKEDRGKLPKQYFGNHFVKPELADVRVPAYRTNPLKDQRGVDRRTTGSQTYVRILPTRDGGNRDQWAPQFEAGNTTGQWLYPVPLWKGGMKKRITIMPWWPWEDDNREVKDRNPVEKLRWGIWRLQEKNLGEFWFKPLVSRKPEAGSVPADLLPDGQKQTNGLLPAVDMTFLVRAIPYKWGEQVCESPQQGLSPDDKVLLLDLGSAASAAVACEVGEYDSTHPDQPTDFSLAKGCFHCIFGNGDDPRKDEQFRRIGAVGSEAFRSDGGPFWSGWPSPDLSAFEAILWDKLVPFHELLIVHPREVQARLLAEVFHPAPLRAAWKDDDELMRIVKDVHGEEQHVPMSPPYQQQYGQPHYQAATSQAYAAQQPQYGQPPAPPQAPGYPQAPPAPSVPPQYGYQTHANPHPPAPPAAPPGPARPSAPVPPSAADAPAPPAAPFVPSVPLAPGGMPSTPPPPVLAPGHPAPSPGSGLSSIQAAREAMARRQAEQAGRP